MRGQVTNEKGETLIGVNVSVKGSTTGVILITTKSPDKDKATLNYSGSYSINKSTIESKKVTNGYEWAKNFDEAFNSWNDYASHPQKANSVFPFPLA